MCSHTGSPQPPAWRTHSGTLWLIAAAGTRESLLTLALAQGVLSQAVTACPEGKGRGGGHREKTRSEGPASTIIPVSKPLVPGCGTGMVTGRVSGVSPATCSFIDLEA